MAAASWLDSPEEPEQGYDELFDAPHFGANCKREASAARGRAGVGAPATSAALRHSTYDQTPGLRPDADTAIGQFVAARPYAGRARVEVLPGFGPGGLRRQRQWR